MPLVGILFYLLIDGCIYTLRPFSEQTMEWYSTIVITAAAGYTAFSLYVFNSKNQHSYWSWIQRGLLLAFAARCVAIVMPFVIERPFAWRMTDEIVMILADGLVVYGLWQWTTSTLSNLETPTDSGQSKAMLASVLMFLLTSMCVIVPAFGLWGDPAYERTINLLLSLLDVLGFLFCIRIFFYYRTLNKGAAPVFVLAVGYGLICLVDPFAQFQSLLGAYHVFHWINMGWVLAYLLIANVAWRIKFDQ